MYDAEGGHASVDNGKVLGIVPPWFKNGWSTISLKEGRFDGSKFKIF